jgi:CRISPR-associated protein Cmr3
MPNYQIKITPAEYFFFGSEKHNDDLSTNYYVASNNYPQQTTLLGMLRYFLLEQNDLLTSNDIKPDAGDVKKLIGEKSFCIGEDNSFGKIESISQLYFNNGIENFAFAPFDIYFEIDNNFTLKKDNKLFNAKDHQKFIKEYLIGQKTDNIIPLDSIIKDREQIGNKKFSKDKGFYKQVLKQLEKNWAFVIDADVDVEIDCTQKYHIPFGGEKSFFTLDFVKQSPFVEELTIKKYNRAGFFILVCTSDCFVDEEHLKKTCFAVNQHSSFRNLQSTINTKSYNNLPRDGDIKTGLKRSGRLQLLKRGSVLYFKDAVILKEFQNSLDVNYLINAGFNKYIPNKINENK